MKQLERARADATEGKWDADSAALRMDGSGHCECVGKVSKFVSAEGCYSCVVFSSDIAAALGLRVKVSPLVLSDHSNAPVWWFKGKLVRCLPHDGSNTNECGEALKAWRANHQNSTLNRNPVPYVPPDVKYKRVAVVRDCFDMHWICRSSPRAALHALPADMGRDMTLRSLDRGDAVQLRPRSGRNSLPDAILMIQPTIELSGDHELVEAPIFHFRKWIDYGKWHAVSLDPNAIENFASFTIRKSGFRTQYQTHATVSLTQLSQGSNSINSFEKTSLPSS